MKWYEIISTEIGVLPAYIYRELDYEELLKEGLKYFEIEYTVRWLKNKELKGCPEFDSKEAERDFLIRVIFRYINDNTNCYVSKLKDEEIEKLCYIHDDVIKSIVIDLDNWNSEYGFRRKPQEKIDEINAKWIEEQKKSRPEVIKSLTYFRENGIM